MRLVLWGTFTLSTAIATLCLMGADILAGAPLHAGHYTLAGISLAGFLAIIGRK